MGKKPQLTINFGQLLPITAEKAVGLDGQQTDVIPYSLQLLRQGENTSMTVAARIQFRGYQKNDAAGNAHAQHIDKKEKELPPSGG
jgi:hypothetical protein